jgi:hypothetical protein
LAQDDLDVGEDGRELTFAEFVNAVARVACEKWEIDSISFMQKLEMAVEAMVSVIHSIPGEFTAAENVLLKQQELKKQERANAANSMRAQKSKRNLFKYRIKVAVKSTQVAREQAMDIHSDVYKRALRRKERRKKKAVDMQKSKTMRGLREERNQTACDVLGLRPPRPPASLPRIVSDESGARHR